MRARVVASCAVAVVLFIGVPAINWVSVHQPLQTVLQSDSRNHGLSVWAYHRYGVLPGEIVLDLRALSATNSSADVTRVLLQFANAKKASEFNRVYLAHRGGTKFALDGTYFRRLGQEYGLQNPVYTLRTLPENLLAPDGRRAFESWTGGWLGVATAQLNDLNTFYQKWFLDDLRGR